MAEIRCASCTNVNITCKELMFICVTCWSVTSTQRTEDPSTLSEACPNDTLAPDQICRYESDVYYNILASRRCGLLRHATPVRGWRTSRCSVRDCGRRTGSGLCGCLACWSGRFSGRSRGSGCLWPVWSVPHTAPPDSPCSPPAPQTHNTDRTAQSHAN